MKITIKEDKKPITVEELLTEGLKALGEIKGFEDNSLALTLPTLPLDFLYKQGDK